MTKTTLLDYRNSRRKRDAVADASIHSGDAVNRRTPSIRHSLTGNAGILCYSWDYGTHGGELAAGRPSIRFAAAV